jgi:hypothetical protein
MVIIASPDWGGSALAHLLLLIGSAVVVLVAIVGVIFGLKLLDLGPTVRRRIAGLLLLLASVSLPAVCFLAPAQIFRLEYGSYPLGTYPSDKIKEGMTFKQVEAILGAPHERFANGNGEEWFYFIDSFCVDDFCVDFGPDGHITNTHGS